MEDQNNGLQKLFFDAGMKAAPWQTILLQAIRPHLADEKLPAVGQLAVGLVAGGLFVDILVSIFEN